MSPRLPSLLALTVIALGLLAATPTPSGKYNPKATDLPLAWKETAEKLIAEEPRSNIKFAGNQFCPVTGKPVDVGVPPIVVRGKYQKMRDLVGVASEDAHKQIDQWLGDVQGNTRRDRMQIFLKAAKDQLLVTGFHKEDKKFVWDTKPMALPADMVKLPPAPRDVQAAIAIDPAKRYQTIDGLGACTYLYKRETVELYGKPETVKIVADDLGFSMIRFNMVPTLFEVKEKVSDISRKDFRFEGEVDRPEGKPKVALHTTPSVLPTLDFMARLQKHNPQIKVIGTVWSPPGWMKTTGLQSFGGSLKPEYYEHFAQYLVEWYRFVQEKYGINLYAISPQNELAFTEPYESCVYSPEAYAKMLAAVADAFAREKIDVKVFGPEDMTHIIPRTMKYIQAVMHDPKAGPRLDIIATHGYSDGIESTGSQSESSEVWKAIKDYKRPYWMTETGYDGDDLWRDGGADGQTMDIGKDKKPLLRQGVLSSVAGRLHYAMVYGNASGWTFWQIIGPGFTEKTGYPVLQQFYRYIRPGMVRIDAGPDGGEKGLCASAYLDPKTNAVSIILINRGDDNVQATLTLNDIAHKNLTARRTAETERFIELPAVPVMDGKAQITLPPRCVVSLAGAP